MKFGVYLPPAVINNSESKKLPALVYLSGLTCTEDNFIQKSGFQKYAAENSIIVINPDTSPRGCKVEGDNESWDFGVGAGFYVDATQPGWSKNYKMHSYVCKEVIQILVDHFNVDTNKIGIFGHSMGGHGALICALKNPKLFRSVSAFAPICNPVQCSWGKKAFSGYLGTDLSAWLAYDSCNLAQNYSGPPIELFIDQGDHDQFYKDKQLLPENLVEASSKNDLVKSNVRFQKGYDHGYFFVSTFIGDHFEHHSKIFNSISH